MPDFSQPLMAEGPAEGEWEEDAGMGAAAAERRREKAIEREKAKQVEETTTQKVSILCEHFVNNTTLEVEVFMHILKDFVITAETFIEKDLIYQYSAGY